MFSGDGDSEIKGMSVYREDKLILKAYVSWLVAGDSYRYGKPAGFLYFLFHELVRSPGESSQTVYFPAELRWELTLESHAELAKNGKSDPITSEDILTYGINEKNTRGHPGSGRNDPTAGRRKSTVTSPTQTRIRPSCEQFALHCSSKRQDEPTI